MGADALRGRPFEWVQSVLLRAGGIADVGKRGGRVRGGGDEPLLPGRDDANGPREQRVFFVKIGGAFRGSPESVAIGTTMYEGQMYWELTATTGLSATGAQARC